MELFHVCVVILESSMFVEFFMFSVDFCVLGGPYELLFSKRGVV